MAPTRGLHQRTSAPLVGRADRTHESGPGSQGQRTPTSCGSGGRLTGDVGQPASQVEERPAQYRTIQRFRDG